MRDAASDAAATDAMVSDATAADATVSDGGPIDGGDCEGWLEGFGWRRMVDVGPAVDGTGAAFTTQLTVDTEGLIASGELAPDCRDLRIAMAPTCTATLAHWVAPHTCDTATTQVWIRVPALAAGESVRFAVYGGQPSATSSDAPEATFDFYEGFDGPALSDAWELLGSATPTFADGVLISQGQAALVARAFDLLAGEAVLTVRGDLQSRHSSDVEIGAAAITTTPLRGETRSWSGATAQSWDESYGLFASAGSWCFSQAGTDWATPWTNPTGFFEMEFSYANVGGVTESHFRTSAGYVADWSSVPSCVAPDRAPVFVLLDHTNDANDPVQHLDYVHVRRLVEATLDSQPVDLQLGRETR
jgi:hypothetical protein